MSSSVNRAINIAGTVMLVCVVGALTVSSAWADGGHGNSLIITPEPSTFALAAAAIVPFALRFRRRK